MASKKKNLLCRLLALPIVPSQFKKSDQITPEEASFAVRNLSQKQFDHCGFLSVFLLLLSVAYMIMYYALDLHPDDLHYSLIAMFLLFGSSLLFGLVVLFFHHFNIRTPWLVRWMSDVYFLSLLVVMGLYFFAASTNKSAPNNFCPSYLYLLIFVVLASPYLVDSLFFVVGGLIVDVTITLVGSMGVVLVLQYSLIGLILIAGTVYLSSSTFFAEIKTLRLNNANAELGFLSTHDQLTSINNRHSLHTYLMDSWAHFIESKTPVAFLLFDIDSFKYYNDKLSHIQGDECLKNVVNAVKQAHLFPESCFYRFGGDEFLVVLQDVDQEGIKKIGAAMVKAIYDAKLPSAPETPLPYVSVSCGGCLAVIEKDKNLDDYLAIADKDLYLAKNSKRNCFYFEDQLVE